jgi:hypothetical protein
MAITAKKIILWRTDVDNHPGALAAALGPIARAGADLKVVMGYRHPSAEGKATVEVFPIFGKKAGAAAIVAGLSAATIPALLVEGDNKPGLGYRVGAAIAAAGINMVFCMAQVIGQKFAAVIGFETDDDAKRAMPAIKSAGKVAKA